MASCETCKHWDKTDSYERLAAVVVRLCSKMPMFWDTTEWSDNYERVMKPEFSGQLAFCQDGSDYSASLLTRAEFFCAHFEAK